MAFPVYFQLFGVRLHPHVVLELVAYGAGFALYLVLRRRWPSGPALTWLQTGWLLVGAIFGALFGARAVAWLEALPALWDPALGGNLAPTGKSIVGALLGGWAGVFLQKFCPEHGEQRVLIAHDAELWQRMRVCTKPPTSPLKRQTSRRRGCPWDCGLCPDHEQHSCLALIEITEQCQLACPVCSAQAETRGEHRSLPQIEAMLDAVVASEGEVSVVQISGGEPTLHPQLLEVLDAARARPIRHLMLNTNGLRIAEDPSLAPQLAAYAPGFEIYLQFDTLRPDVSRRLRGADLVDVKRRAIEILDQHGISTTLVVTVVRGENDDELGDLVRFAVAHPCVRGVTLQPLQGAGRLQGLSAEQRRITLTEVRAALIQQQAYFGDADLVPVPCNGDALAMAYGLRQSDGVVPLSTWIDPSQLTAVGGNTISYEQDPELRQHLHRLFSLSANSISAATQLNALCCAPGTGDLPLGYDRVFRVILMQFMDAWNMDLRSLKRSCVHIADPDGRLVPFETYNLLHRPRSQNGEHHG